MSLTKAIAILKKKPNATKAAVDKKIGNPLPESLWNVALQSTNPKRLAKIVEANCKDLTGGDLPSSTTRGRRPAQAGLSRNTCVAILKNDINTTHAQAAEMLGSSPSRSSYLRAQVQAGGATDFQRRIFTAVMNGAQELQDQGLDPWSLTDGHISDQTGSMSGTQYRSVVMASDEFKERFTKKQKAYRNPYRKATTRTLRKGKKASQNILRVAMPTTEQARLEVQYVEEDGTLYLVVNELKYKKKD